MTTVESVYSGLCPQLRELSDLTLFCGRLSVACECHLDQHPQLNQNMLVLVIGSQIDYVEETRED